MTAPFDPPLQVEPRHLQELGDQHSAIAGQIGQAAPLTDGVAGAVTRSHGPVCHPLWSKLADAEALRREACTAMQATSERYATNLTDAARRYRATDEDSAGAISDAGPQ
ncbi:ESX-1 secretion-associated protein [Mycolicibacterium sp. F2034L]|uniref:ESX-1 secretion-associated protein n=1 Tax=Mycolicibacterium sp. F2034L TaxID=2926422 RepID=UPI001FF3E5A9|nr:ESX-1 secretion-associated protein [Mycolicibacterium sp. F2034L]MCK0175551.1 ESX-1 secretion-associated protein [Mycolicibacterium sp. F2034L]